MHLASFIIAAFGFGWGFFVQNMIEPFLKRAFSKLNMRNRERIE
jgi:hypothetical protein